MANPFEGRGSRFSVPGHPKQVNPLTKKPFGYNPGQGVSIAKVSETAGKEKKDVVLDSNEYARRIKEIRTNLENGEGDARVLGREFVELWKNIPDNVSDDVHDDIDGIRSALMDK